MAFTPASGRDVCAARPIVWQRHLTWPWCAMTTLSSVGSATMAASGGRGKNSFADGPSSLHSRLSAFAPVYPHSSLTVQAKTSVGHDRDSVLRDNAASIAAILPFTSHDPR